MSLTQVSTWFANARRRLKKENKWSPDGSCDDSENVSESGASEEAAVEQRIPQLPTDESGYSSSDRDSGSPPIPLAPPTMNFPMSHPALNYLGGLSASKSESSLHMPRYMPTTPLNISPISATKRQARSLWSIADIAGNDDNDNIDVTA